LNERVYSFIECFECISGSDWIGVKKSEPEEESGTISQQLEEPLKQAVEIQDSEGNDGEWIRFRPMRGHSHNDYFTPFVESFLNWYHLRQIDEPIITPINHRPTLKKSPRFTSQ
jgi:hypothetical protein